MGMTSTLFLCGDVMTGRGVDQILPHPSAPHLNEEVAKSALEYVAWAERATGAIRRPVDHSYVWGVALAELERRQQATRIINLETSVTTSEDVLPKGINYRMHPDNVPVLLAAGIDCAVVANNHVLDWGPAGLNETLDTLARAGIRTAGAGRTLLEAEAPAVIPAVSGGRFLVFAFGGADSGIPQNWAAGPAKSGIFFLGDYSRTDVERIASLVESTKRAGDIAVASVHWGGNWGYDIPAAHRRFAHELIEYAGIDVVHGHSSHHPKAIEVYLGRPILYGCGDFLNDYEGIGGYEKYRSELVVMYFVTLDVDGGLDRLEMVPLQIRHFQLGNVARADADWVRRTLDRECRRFGHRVISSDGHLLLEWK
jgi:poly-gamma-glutamate synthesis protein (capsule biosynthesis protein)